MVLFQQLVIIRCKNATNMKIFSICLCMHYIFFTVRNSFLNMIDHSFSRTSDAFIQKFSYFIHRNLRAVYSILLEFTFYSRHRKESSFGAHCE